MDATIASRGRIEVRGGKLRVAGEASPDRGTRPADAEIDVGSEVVVIGRNEACDLVLDDGKVSAMHAELVATARGVRVRDLGSRNGTFIGETRIAEAYLTQHTLLALGSSSVEFTRQPCRARSTSPRPAASGRSPGRAAACARSSSG